MAKLKLKVNGKVYEPDVEGDMPLLWVLRDYLGLTGTKFGCGIAICGACTVLIDGKAVRSCIIPVVNTTGQEITTIEGLDLDNNHPLQKAWVAEQVPQCGYCQSGQLMAAAALLNRNPAPSENEVEAEMNGIMCRCGTYPRIKKAIKSTLKSLTNE